MSEKPEKLTYTEIEIIFKRSGFTRKEFADRIMITAKRLDKFIKGTAIPTDHESEQIRNFAPDTPTL